MSYAFHKRYLVYFFLVVLLTLGSKKLVDDNNTPLVSPFLSTPAASQSASPSVCESSLWAHIYHAQRLQVIDNCRTVTGTVEVMRVEKDGDFHVLFRLDPPFADLVNQVNIDKQKGDLVIEPICENPVSQADAVTACQGFAQNLSIHIGDHLSVTGAYVTDLDHGWRELHPITSVSKL